MTDVAEERIEEQRLFGLPGAEHFHFDLATAYETSVEPYHDEHDDRPVTIEEWSVCSASKHIPNAEYLLELITDWAGDNGELDEDGYFDFEHASKAEDVLDAFRSALNLLASKVTYRMADKLLHTHEITWDANGAPCIDGAPLYVSRP